MRPYRFRARLTELGRWTASPWAFGVVVGYGLLWFVFDRAQFDFIAVATLAVWAMTLVIQRAEHRDTQAIHAKLDELLRATGAAEKSLATIDQAEPEEIEDARAERQADDDPEHTQAGRGIERP